MLLSDFTAGEPSSKSLLPHNAALSGAPKGHPSPVPGSPRSVAEGRTRHHRSAPHSPRSEAEGGTIELSGGCKPSAGVVGYPISLCCFSQTDTHSRSGCKGDKHFKAEPLPFASDQV